MRIGIDFDNTIAKYDEIFIKTAIQKKFIKSNWLGNKESLKAEMIAKKKEWQILQGLVYGPLMRNATFFPGFKFFVSIANLFNYEIFIISHKTIYGHFDHTKTKLRVQAMLWLKENDFFKSNLFSLKKDNVFFCNSRNEKINKIKNLNLNFMIDDLNEIFEELSTLKTKKILFNSNLIKNNADHKLENWRQISNLIFTEQQINKGLIEVCNKINKNKNISSIKQIKRNGNSTIYKIKDCENNFQILKEYPCTQLDVKPRLSNEINALQLLDNFKNVPKIVNFDKDMNLLILTYIKGKKINKISYKNLDECLLFIKELSKLNSSKKYKFATEACLNAKELTNQIDNRFIQLKLIKDKDLEITINKLVDLYDKVKKRAFDLWPNNNIDKNLNIKDMTFSPSDFGFHNAILGENKKVFFIDFEYFGLDDPVKLIADFLWHPGMILTTNQKLYFTKKFFEIFEKDKYLKKRLNASFSLYGIRWGLIILNKYLYTKVNNTSSINDSGQNLLETQLKLQLTKSNMIYDNIIKNNMEFIYDK